MQERNRKGLKRKHSFIRMAVVVIPLVFVLLLSQTVFAQNTYVITDGDRVLIHTSSETDPAAVLGEAGLALGADDTYTTQAGLGVSEITVQRSQTVTVRDGDKELQVTSRGETVEEMLDRLGIPTDGTISVSAELDAMTYDGMELSVYRTLRSTESYTASIPHGVSYVYDASIPEGTTEVLVKGVDGQAACTASVVYEDGAEVSRIVLSQEVIDQPVDEVIAIGTGGEEAVPGYVSDQPIIGDGYIITSTGEVLTYTDTIQVTGTAYSRNYKLRYTYSGTIVEIGSVAVDPSVIPLGTRMFIVSNDGEYVYGVATAEDTGKGVNGAWVDLYMETTELALEFGQRDCTVYILGEADLVRQDIKR